MSITTRQDAAAAMRGMARATESRSVEERADSPAGSAHLRDVAILFRMAADWVEHSEEVTQALIHAAVEEAADQRTSFGRRAAADDDEIARHAEKQGVSRADAWRYFEINGYDMSAASPQYDS